MKLIFGYLAGLLFGLGLAIGGMTDPHRVQGFSTSLVTGTQRSYLLWAER